MALRAMWGLRPKSQRKSFACSKDPDPFSIYSYVTENMSETDRQSLAEGHPFKMSCVMEIKTIAVVNREFKSLEEKICFFQAILDDLTCQADMRKWIHTLYALALLKSALSDGDGAYKEYSAVISDRVILLSSSPSVLEKEYILRKRWDTSYRGVSGFISFCCSFKPTNTTCGSLKDLVGRELNDHANPADEAECLRVFKATCLKFNITIDLVKVEDGEDFIVQH
ncbi:hypothetical protein 3 [Hubei dimarhabdovirus virus 3]|uniref:hypothetical protein 3 n=1 Tax=Hubei dimarhabdovirus virus 3 TaxID=1922868 RepID=UPI0009096839|nr:hypothetical protein 3 [Hubei dimarhabdovirus virus 3]APG78713.1 hypothetical protein 3 [Hubei dimarhabdovirus virus 3]